MIHADSDNLIEHHNIELQRLSLIHSKFSIHSLKTTNQCPLLDLRQPLSVKSRMLRYLSLGGFESK
jgi:hypothetical protein